MLTEFGNKQKKLNFFMGSLKWIKNDNFDNFKYAYFSEFLHDISFLVEAYC